MPDAGLTLLELIVTISIASILMAIGFFAMQNFLKTHRHLGTARDVRSALRNANEAALSQGRTMCVYFTATTWATYKSSCTVAANKIDGPNQVLDPAITVTSVSFPAPATPIPNQTTSCPNAGKCAYFYPRGTALGGSLQVTRPGKTYTISVEGLTSRVSMG